MSKLKGNLISTAKALKLGFFMLIPMVLTDYFSGEFDESDLIFWLVLSFMCIPIFTLKVFAYTFVESLKYHKFTKAVLWGGISSNIIVTAIFIGSYFAPPMMAVIEYFRYVAIFTVLFFAIYYQLPYKESV